MLAVEKITLNYETTLTGCETLPVFGWIITSTLRDVQQRSWRLQLSAQEDFAQCLFDSGEMHDDPVVYAIKDRGSRVTVLAMISTVLLAHFLTLGALS